MMRMWRAALLGLVLAVVALTSGCTSETPGERHTPDTTLGRSTIQPPHSGRPRAALRARIVLPTTTIHSGSSISGHVIVQNNTGDPLHVVDCLSPFAVALGNDKIQARIAFPTCAQPLTIPAGRSSWPVTVRAIYFSCGGESSSPPCVHGHIPGLPPGHYRAKLFQSPHIAPAPPSILVRVTR